VIRLTFLIKRVIRTHRIGTPRIPEVELVAIAAEGIKAEKNEEDEGRIVGKYKKGQLQPLPAPRKEHSLLRGNSFRNKKAHCTPW